MTTLPRTNSPVRFIKLKEVLKRTTLSTSELYRRIADGTFPKQVPLGPRSVAWIEFEIENWCAEIAAARKEG